MGYEGLPNFHDFKRLVCYDTAACEALYDSTVRSTITKHDIKHAVFVLLMRIHGIMLDISSGKSESELVRVIRYAGRSTHGLQTSLCIVQWNTPVVALALDDGCTI